jgi:alcohol dehydrogenase class IV
MDRFRFEYDPGVIRSGRGRVTEVRDALGLPTRLRDVDGPAPAAFEAVAAAILGDSFMDNTPPGLEPTVEEIESVLQAAY